MKFLNSNTDVKRLNEEELGQLAEEIRGFLIDTVSKTGGHLASNLGVVELTLAIHRVFDVYKDRIVWDVGHQTYTHKLLTGRFDDFGTLRSMGGISGFPKTAESAADAFDTGHSSTSISAAFGFAEANKLSGGDACAVAVIGDGAMTGGMAFEALNHAGSTKTPIVVILNDNGMSISKNVGGMARHLRKIRNKTEYYNFKAEVNRVLGKIPIIGEPLRSFIREAKRRIKRILISQSLFEDLGFTYLGPVDGHDIGALETVLKQAKKLKEPVLVHIHTIKGKGYEFAEKNPDMFHGIGEFDPNTGESRSSGGEDYSELFGKTLCRLAEKNEKIVGVTAAMRSGTGLLRFSEKFPSRFYDVGIAEQHAVTFSAGLATAGYIPVFAVYSSFLQRAYDQLLHDVALQNLHVVFAIDRAGAVGRDGATHQGIYDLSYLSHLPNMTVLSPSCGEDFERMLDFAVNSCAGPVAIRYPRANVESAKWECGEVRLGCAQSVRRGGEVLIVALGDMVREAVRAAELLEGKNISAGVIDARFLKPFDSLLVRKCAKNAAVVASVEDNTEYGGLAERVREAVGRDIISFAYPDAPLEHGTVSELRHKFGLDAESMAKRIEMAFLHESDKRRFEKVSG